LGGFVILARALDKGRATVVGKQGEYHFDCPLDKRFLDFVKIDGAALFEQIREGKGDGEILEWILQNAGYKPTPWETNQWSQHNEARTPDSLKAKERVVAELLRLNSQRTDILTGFDLLDLDDHVSFGGKA
jgi:hypothetical protein